LKCHTLARIFPLTPDQRTEAAFGFHRRNARSRPTCDHLFRSIERSLFKRRAVRRRRALLDFRIMLHCTAARNPSINLATQCLSKGLQIQMHLRTHLTNLQMWLLSIQQEKESTKQAATQCDGAAVCCAGLRTDCLGTSRSGAERRRGKEASFSSFDHPRDRAADCISIWLHLTKV